MLKANEVLQVYVERDELFFKTIVDEIDQRIGDKEWLLDKSNYNRDAIDQFTFNFEPVELLVGVRLQNECRWLPESLIARLIKHYEQFNWYVAYNEHSNKLSLRAGFNDESD